MNILETEIEGVVIIEPQIFSDSRGYFYESFSQREFSDKVCRTTFVQDNQAKSSYGVLRGLHFQKPPYAQSKLVKVVKGRVMDVVVDIRSGSATYGRYVCVELSEQNNRQLFIPRGFAHGYITLSDEAIFQYKCDNYYNKESESSIIWDDPMLDIEWDIDESNIILSEKDKLNGGFANFVSPFSYEVNYYE